jgi:hypothetical protein
MKFKVTKESDLYKKLMALHDRLISVRDEANKCAKDLGFTEYYHKSMVLGGGFYGLVPVDGKTKTDGYSWAFSDREGNAVMPSKLTKNKEILERIKNLPVVHYEELNELVDYKEELSHRPSGKGHGTAMNFCPATSWGKGYVLIDIPVYNGKYKPVDGMIEILESEYNTLHEKIK